ncbi:hypothetical protein SAMD00019534_027190, partial [Acytostelium subglobosum LB1]|uniref:hypothetical protein n=1 Tax=Acytostelium subglobosum LB1 TaxID=1410327 RepID=UPI000644C419
IGVFVVWSVVAEVAGSDQRSMGEICEEWPLTSCKIMFHALKRLSWNKLVIKPLNDRQAYTITGNAQKKDSFDIMKTTIDILKAVVAANGESPLDSLIYGPIIALNQIEEPHSYQHPGGGYGSGKAGVGDQQISGIFIHEMGHSLDLQHSAEFPNRYPYPKGSLLGSAPGFNVIHNEFLETIFRQQQSSTLVVRANRTFKSKMASVSSRM